ncbi:MAG: ABC transporter ATP-binding protein, partial [Stellaceae bacterium]
VQDLDLEIAETEFVSLLGPSGCGKTTTLRMLAGLDFPTSGTIRIGGRVVTELPPGKRDIAMVFQSYALYPHMTVAENIAYPLRKRGVPRREREAKVMAAARLLRLEALVERKPRHLSGGQQQRVALGRALVREPEVFLLDEPLSNLDAKLRAHMRAELIELHRRIGKTMVYVTHDQLEAMTMSDRIAILHGGVLQQFGTPADVYERPANVFVADFIGTPSMTLFEGTLHRLAGRLEARIGSLVLPLPEDHVNWTGSPDTLAIRLGVRPEDVLLGETGEPAVVKLVEPTGHENIVLITVHGLVATARSPADVRLRPNEAVRVGFRTAKIHVFDRDAGTRLNSDGPARVTPFRGLQSIGQR